MSSQKQINANRQNAKKSTGPKTPEGKAKSAQNATTHGLTASSDVIKGESQEQFDAHKQGFLDVLSPQNAVEDFLAGRVVSLAWRLKRAERIQNMLVDCMLLDHPFIIEDIAFHHREPSNHNPDLTLGAVISRDFRNDKILDRFKLYERRIENSMFKCLNALNYRKRKTPTDPMHAPSRTPSTHLPINASTFTACAKRTQSPDPQNAATSMESELYNLCSHLVPAPIKPNQTTSDTLTNTGQHADPPRKPRATVRRY